ncbi:MAG: CoA pyrophosphatase [Gammaproteobacteria bacterium]|nr:CoA pyrophosphatase [Gammaproteobacteria bacterium]MBQ0840086.1 CoA pyrophosphatase [Gammaproteobacteria bacterium]
MLNKISEQLVSLPPAALQPAEGGREAAVLLALTREHDPQLVFIQRAQHMNSHPGQVAFPGGKWEQGDSSLLSTALRESEEEVALAPAEVELVARLPQRRTRLGVQVTPYLGFIRPGLELLADPSELEAIFHVPLSYLLEPKHLIKRQVDVLGSWCWMPCYHYAGYTIWGFTLTVLVDMLNRVFDVGLCAEIDRADLPADIRQQFPHFPEGQ